MASAAASAKGAKSSKTKTKTARGAALKANLPYEMTEDPFTPEKLSSVLGLAAIGYRKERKRGDYKRKDGTTQPHKRQKSAVQKFVCAFEYILMKRDAHPVKQFQGAGRLERHRKARGIDDTSACKRWADSLMKGKSLVHKRLREKDLFAQASPAKKRGRPPKNKRKSSKKDSGASAAKKRKQSNDNEASTLSV